MVEEEIPKSGANRVPRHIGIILDGNRRFAKKLMLKPWMGHEWGAKKVEQLLNWITELGIREVTLYSFSMQNFDRPKEEFEFLMQLFKKEFSTIINEQLFNINAKGIRMSFIGRINLFPRYVQDLMLELMEKTKSNNKFLVNFAMAYGGREEVIDAVQKIGEQIKRGKLDVTTINEQSFGKYLYLNSDPDLIIRTGGEHRTSNFLIWQSWYAEWVFLDKTWPEFEKEDLLCAVKEYEERERRLGK